MATLDVKYPIDLRSDTVTKPSQPMREAMAAAEVGDDQYGEDPTVRLLEETVAALFGFEAAMFVPTGVMANHIGIRLQVAPGEELLCDADAHIVAHENGGLAAHAGIQTRTLPSVRGLLDPTALAATIRTGDPYTVGTRALEVENTHNRGGGAVYPIDTLREIRALADTHGLGLHLDGARIWNAHKATGVPLDAYGATAHTMSVCMSKGLGAPAGSLLLLSADRAAEARALRRRLGGAMRQSGILAAGALYGLEHNLNRLTEDHANAENIAAVLKSAGASVRDPETNIVLIDAEDAPAIAKACFAKGVRISAFGPKLLRIVTHLDVSSQDCDTAADVVSSALMQSTESR